MQNYRLPPEAAQLLDQHGVSSKIEAIKITREKTGLDLSGAKSLVEEYLLNPKAASAKGHGVAGSARTASIKIGAAYEGRVSRLMDFGAFVTIQPGRDGLLHISQIRETPVERVSDCLAVGQVVKVRVLEEDAEGRLRLSMKGLPQESMKFEYKEDGKISPEAVNALKHGQQFEAIRLMRQQSGLSLKEAKEAVERYLEKNPKWAERFRALAPGWCPLAPEQPEFPSRESPDYEKCVIEAIKSAGAGFLIGLVLWIPSCVVGTIANGREAAGEEFATTILVIVPIVGLIIGWIKATRAEEERISKKEESDLASRNQHIAATNVKFEKKVEQKILEQISIGEDIKSITNSAQDSFGAMPHFIANAEQLLDQAEIEFKDGAFAPFWDRIEEATNQVGRFDDGVQIIRSNSDRYVALTKSYLDVPVRFPITVDAVTGMAVANTTSDRLRKVVRVAQRNFQFASIYEQRKTNQILVAGFRSLGQALDGMGQRISASIENLADEISSMASTMERSFCELGERIEAGNEMLAEGIGSLSSSIDALHETTKRSAREGASRADALHAFQKENSSKSSEQVNQALEMLDDIRRHRKPIWSNPIDDLGKEPAP